MTEEPTPEELEWLVEIQNGQLLGSGAATALTDGVKSRLLELGLIEEELGGYVVTGHGRKALPM